MKRKITTLYYILLFVVSSCTKTTKEKEISVPPLIQKGQADTVGNSIDTIAYRNSVPNASDILNLNNYLNNTQNIHPKVLYFEKGWKGYKFWMAYTPYPKGDVKYENPCIAASNDGINWASPNGFKDNPLDIPFEDGYNSDTHLVYREDLDILECWYRPYNIKTKRNSICRRVTHDGINWQPKEIIFNYNDIQMLSPAVIFENGQYKIWYCYGGETRYIESLDSSAKNWQREFSVLKYDWTKLYPWHIDVIKTDFGYEMIVCAWDKGVKGANNNSADLFYCSTNNYGQIIDHPFPIIKRNKNKNAFDFRSIYRASFLKIKGRYYVYYSAISENWTRSMALSLGTNLHDLRGYRLKKE